MAGIRFDFGLRISTCKDLWRFRLSAYLVRVEGCPSSNFLLAPSARYSAIFRDLLLLGNVIKKD
jgi:hypothetical protein